jgi:hypothetical protein
MGRRRLRVGRVSVATRQLVQVQLGRPQLNGDSLRQRGRLNGYINVLLLRQLDSNKQCFHNLYGYLCAARNKGDIYMGVRRFAT